eukprot:67966-Chlamydomonas_euryale.AAC.1
MPRCIPSPSPPPAPLPPSPPPAPPSCDLTLRLARAAGGLGFESCDRLAFILTSLLQPLPGGGGEGSNGGSGGGSFRCTTPGLSRGDAPELSEVQ